MMKSSVFFWLAR